MLHYSGDADGVVPLLGTKRWIAATGWKTTKTWKPWEVELHTAGYVEEYGQFTLATVHGSGHQASVDKRDQVTKLVTNFIKGIPLA